jgi:hypothetical protein
MLGTLARARIFADIGFLQLFRRGREMMVDPAHALGAADGM